SHFDKSAKNLSRREAALIAATLPNPIKFNSQNPSNYMRKRQRQIVSLMGKIGPVNLEK
ncbi:MAG: monofunctional biosynthetic peptidoglycan transglycosylase, partial [Muribaculaceae bacterium]